MKTFTFNDIVSIITSACKNNFYNGTGYDNMHVKIIESATNIYIKQMEIKAQHEDKGE